MRLLLDTHIFLWSLLEPERLPREIAHALRNPGTQLWISPISTWECLLLADKGRIELDPDPISWIRNALKVIPAREAPVTHDVAVHSRLVNLPHPDPADRFVVATALARHLTFATADERIRAAAPCELLT